MIGFAHSAVFTRTVSQSIGDIGPGRLGGRCYPRSYLGGCHTVGKSEWYAIANYWDGASSKLIPAAEGKHLG